jgi:hypothetical protein
MTTYQPEMYISWQKIHQFGLIQTYLFGQVDSLVSFPLDEASKGLTYCG